MKILFFSRLFYPHIGGVEKHVMEVGRRLADEGHQVIVVSEDLPEYHVGSLKKSKDSGEISGIRYYQIPVGENSRLKKFQIWAWLWEHKELISDADIVHCHDVFFWYLPFRFLYPFKSVYVTFHGYESYPIKKKAIIVRKISEILSFGNICIGDFIHKWYGTNPTFVSYGGVDIPKTPINTKVKRESAIFFGRFDDQTGILDYVDAVEIVKKKYKEFALLIAGDGKYKRQLRKKNVKMIGFQKDPLKLLKLYNYVFVSRYLSMLEAMAANRLVFAVFDNPVKEDYLKMSPFAKYTVLCSSKTDIANKLMYYLDHPEEERKKIEAAYRWAEGQKWGNVISTYIKLWKV